MISASRCCRMAPNRRPRKVLLRLAPRPHVSGSLKPGLVAWTVYLKRGSIECYGLWGAQTYPHKEAPLPERSESQSVSVQAGRSFWANGEIHSQLSWTKAMILSIYLSHIYGSWALAAVYLRDLIVLVTHACATSTAALMLASVVCFVCVTGAQFISRSQCDSLLVCNVLRRLNTEAATNYNQTGCCYWTHRLAAKMGLILCGDYNRAFLYLEMKALCMRDVYICSHNWELYHDQWMVCFEGEVRPSYTESSPRGKVA
ncbi:hypothetical protein BP00DRAFT_223312 [Aspergillus indologenus CBS 114.80]|uniref:Uncharacterized protein n=1 Tax=Aspergillus indologenus CBS 114.80 TaxID=1450541 RepID=A0A2V5I173_9EURO|nr:hypothetical protein BP00DRAFT_223312 [Aspergillus indologenus CBS 114.80]